MRLRIFFSVIFFFVFVLWGIKARSQRPENLEPEPKKIDLAAELRIFGRGDSNYSYSISLCADIPNERKPGQVLFQGETGHVFLILQKIRDADTLSKVFGFYPKSGNLPTAFTRNVKSAVKDNSGRRYEASVTRMLSPTEFDAMLDTAVALARPRYRLNKYNCYDYAVKVFNAVAREQKIVVKYSKFPFMFGRGGSPCSLYEVLAGLHASGGKWAEMIHFAASVAPVSSASPH